MNKIEEMIAAIEEYIDNCKPLPLSNNKIIVEKDAIEELLRELRLRTPDEIKKYQKIISNKEAILADAKDQADSMLNAAKVHTQELVNEHEIMQRAYSEAEEIRDQAYSQAQAVLDQATEEANQMRYSAVQYTDDMLANLQRIIEHSIESNRSKYESLLNALDKDLNVVMSNRNELAGIEEDEEKAQDETDDKSDADDAAAGLQESGDGDK